MKTASIIFFLKIHLNFHHSRIIISVKIVTDSHPISVVDVPLNCKPFLKKVPN